MEHKRKSEWILLPIGSSRYDLNVKRRKGESGQGGSKFLSGCF